MELFAYSLVECMVKKFEKLHGNVGNYRSHDEHPLFSNNLLESMFPLLHYNYIDSTNDKK